ncbi:MAG: alpha/beta fold hydrolase, partial [Acetobacteraceae bacterium]|nr:alpha/beta fold hydrolase [Acetobacteraceae bacterium]
MPVAVLPPLDPDRLPAGLGSRFLEGINGLRVHLLEAGEPGRPLVLLLHGFPEIAYSWRRVMPGLAAAGYHVVAPDARGYGRTTGSALGYDVELWEFGILNLVRDAASIVAALGRSEVALVAGHDYGAGTAAACALVRPDIFRRLALMSAPFGGPPALLASPAPDLAAELAALDPPRKHYHWYYSTRHAAPDMEASPQGLHAFLRAYFHQKSADWSGNEPFPLKAWSAEELAKLPGYYVMPLEATMPEAVAPFMPAEPPAWLTDAELALYAEEYGRTGFQGGLNWYRLRTGGQLARELSTFAGRTIDVPSCFYAGAAD